MNFFQSYIHPQQKERLLFLAYWVISLIIWSMYDTCLYFDVSILSRISEKILSSRPAVAQVLARVLAFADLPDAASKFEVARLTICGAPAYQISQKKQGKKSPNEESRMGIG